MPPPYKNSTCRGSYVLRTACGRCERCADERKQIFDADSQYPNGVPADPPQPRWTDEVLEAFVRQDVAANAIIAFRQMRALESLAESLAELGRYLTTK